VFTIELPVSSTVLESAGPDAGADLTIRQKKVLVVDDDSAVATLLAEILTIDGHQVQTALNAATALEHLDERSYDLVISDMRMPVLDGPGFYREVELRHSGRRPPFVFVTGDILGADSLKLLEKTKVPCLTKPFAPGDVRRAIHLALAAAKSSRGLLRSPCSEPRARVAIRSSLALSLRPDCGADTRTLAEAP